MKHKTSRSSQWKTHTKNGVAHTKKAIRTIGKNISKDIRKRFHHEKAPKSPVQKPNYVMPRNRTSECERNISRNSHQDLPEIIEHLVDSEVHSLSNLPQHWHHSNTSSISGRRESDASHISQSSNSSFSSELSRRSTRAQEMKPAAPHTVNERLAPNTPGGKVLEKLNERSGSPTRVTTWPRRNTEKSQEDLSEEERENQENKNKIIFVSETLKQDEQVLKEGTHINKGEEDSNKKDSDKSAAGSTVDQGMATFKAEMRKLYSPTDMTRQLLAVQMQRMRSGNRKDSAKFLELWENKLLPEIAQVLNERIGNGYSINIRSGHELGHRIIDIMTNKNAGSVLEEVLTSIKTGSLPPELDIRTKFEFRGGTRGYCTSEASLTLDQTVNGSRYSLPLMGDSVGTTAEGCDGGATLGPVLKIGGACYRLLNWHIFDDNGSGNRNFDWSEQEPPELDVVHPSPDDLRTKAPDQSHVPIGKTTVAYSGPMYNTSRMSKLLGHRVTTDWVLCKTKFNGLNKVRHVTFHKRRGSFSSNIVGTEVPERGSMVYSTGRSSGWTAGLICEALAMSKLSDGTVTREWAVESVNPPGNDSSVWNMHGMGVPGDSGAGIVSVKNNKLVGQLWGRNDYERDAEFPRVTYFTAISDIYDDIQDRWPTQEGPRNECPRPTLPGEAETQAAYAGRASPLHSINEDAELETFMNGSSPDRRSRALPTFSKNDDGVTLTRNWIIFNHAKTWPMPLKIL